MNIDIDNKNVDINTLKDNVEITIGNNTLQTNVDNTNVDLSPEQKGVDLQFGINRIATGGTQDHSELENLDYEHSGHTGFQPSGDYALRSEIPDVSNFVEDENYVHTDNNFTNIYKQKLDNLVGQEIQISSNEPTIDSIKLWYQIEDEVDLDNFSLEMVNGELVLTYQDGIDLDFDIENNDLIVYNNVEDLDFNINLNQELEVEYGN